MNQLESGAADALLKEANALYASGQLAQAGPIYRGLLKQFPRKLFLLNRMAELTFRRKNFKESVKFLRRSLEAAQEQPLAWLLLGGALSKGGDPQAAMEAYDHATKLQPDLAAAHNEKGVVLLLQGRAEEAVACLDRAIALQPNFAMAILTRGQALKKMDRYEEAMAAFHHAIELSPRMAVAHMTLGFLFLDLGREEEALACFDAALAIDPEVAEASAAKAEILLKNGDYDQGWKLYGSRLGTSYRKDFAEQSQFAGCPFWTGDGEVAGKTIVLRPEVGLGDFLMFARYVKLVQQRGAKVILYAPEPLVTLFESIRPPVQVVPSGQVLPAVDLQCPIMDLPRVFGTTLQTVPDGIPYLSASAEKRAAWHQRLGPKQRPRIGLMWSGKGDRNIDRNALRRRSMPLASLRPLLELPLEFHALQKEILSGEEAGLAACTNLTAHTGELADMSDTAALIAEMDLVISIDTSVAHLAGALGKPLWVTLPFTCDYRWTARGDQTPWYPAAKLFRQAQAGDWAGVMARVADQLVAHFEVSALHTSL